MGRSTTKTGEQEQAAATELMGEQRGNGSERQEEEKLWVNIRRDIEREHEKPSTEERTKKEFEHHGEKTVKFVKNPSENRNKKRCRKVEEVEENEHKVGKRWPPSR